MCYLWRFCLAAPANINDGNNFNTIKCAKVETGLNEDFCFYAIDKLKFFLKYQIIPTYFLIYI